MIFLPVYKFIVHMILIVATLQLQEILFKILYTKNKATTKKGIANFKNTHTGPGEFNAQEKKVRRVIERGLSVLAGQNLSPIKDQ